MALDESYAYCATLVRGLDKDRFLAALFAPEAVRPHLLALAAFNVEVSRVRQTAREPMPGEIRLAWWREVLEGQGRGDVQGNPVAEALMDTIARCALPTASLVALTEARTFDLYDDPMPSLADLEGYAGETTSALLQLSALTLDAAAAPKAAEASGHGGVALALTGLMRTFPVQAARGQCFLPLDLLKKHGGGREDAVSGKPGAALQATLGDVRAAARAHLFAAAEALRDLPATLAPAFLPLALVPGDLAALARVRDPFQQTAGLSPFRRQLGLWRAARRAGRGKPLFKL